MVLLWEKGDTDCSLPNNNEAFVAEIQLSRLGPYSDSKG